MYILIWDQNQYDKTARKKHGATHFLITSPDMVYTMRLDKQLMSFGWTVDNIDPLLLLHAGHCV